MRYRLRHVAFLFPTMALLLPACDPSGLDSGGAAGKPAIVAVVGAESIGLSEFRDWLVARPGSVRRVARPGGAESELDHLIELMLVERELVRRGTDADPVYLAEREALRLRARLQERELARATMLRQLAESVRVTDESLRARYEASSGRFVTSRIHLRKIAVSDRETALELKAALDRGADFAELAARSNLDPALRASRGDLGPWFRAEVPPALRASAYQLFEEGEVGEPFEANAVWNILQLVTRENSVPRGFETTRNQLERELRKALALEAYGELLEALRVELGVEVDAEQLAKVGPPAPGRLAKRRPRRPPSLPAGKLE